MTGPHLLDHWHRQRERCKPCTLKCAYMQLTRMRSTAAELQASIKWKLRNREVELGGLIIVADTLERVRTCFDVSLADLRGMS